MAKQEATPAMVQAEWIDTLTPHAGAPVEAVGLLSPAGSMLSPLAGMAGRSVGGFVGQRLAKRFARKVEETRSGGSWPEFIAAAVTADSVKLFEAEQIAGSTNLHIVGPLETWRRSEVRVTVSGSNAMTTSLKVEFDDGRTLTLEARKNPLSKVSPSEAFIAALS